MSIFRRLFSARPKRKKGEPSEGFDQPRGKAGRAPRVQIFWLHHVAFIPDRHFHAQPVRVANLSTSGMGLILGSNGHPPDSGELLTGSLDLNGQRYPASARVVHITKGVLGCHFEGSGLGKLQQAIERYFEVEIVAQQMELVRTESTSPGAGATAHWFHSPDNLCELYFQIDGIRLTRFYLSFFSNYFEGGEGGPTRYGRISANRSREEGRFVPPSSVVWEPKSPQAIQDLALKLLGNIPELQPEHRNLLAQLLKSTYLR